MKINMGEIRKITISGFRGINMPPLELDFQSGRSMMIYGRNGSGKSSIVDAWEWLYSGRIEHLAKEGAKERAFPHKEAKNGQTWVEVEFKNREIGKIRAEFDPSRITKPEIEGNLSEMKEIIPHPCYLRYRDITEFVYKEKAKKYEKLSSQMGFGKALDIQNQLQTGTKRVEKELEKLKRDRDDCSKEYRDVSGVETDDIGCFIKTLNVVFNRLGITSITELTELDIRFENLRIKVENDESTKKLSLWKNIQGIINQFYPVEDICSDISTFQNDFIEFKQDEGEISKFVLLDLYENGIEAIESLEINDRCPLCDQIYEDNLIEYITSKQSHLDELRKKRKELEEGRKEIFSLIDGIVRKIENANTHLEKKEFEPLLIYFKTNLINLILPLKECKDIFGKRIEDIDEKSDFLTKVDTNNFKSLLDLENEIKEVISRQVESLENDDFRKALVDDFQRLNELRRSFLKLKKLNKMIERLEEIKSAYEKIRDDYVEDTKKNVQESFDAISSDVAKYFKILERDNDNLSNPEIKLYSENDKAVELEIMFGGEPIRPAYKFLSESQLNSFGLSVFLASAKHFNPEFKFIILDDIINSFDTYKRPRVIDLLSEHFSDYQILLLTHDSIWLDRLQKSFPTWIRKLFLGWDYTIGPRVEPGKNSYEQIDELLYQDKPTEAGWMFGRYLEWVFQELCVNLEASVKYNKRNEYSLLELFQAFKSRIQNKIKADHSIVKLILDFEVDTGFRNFCDHWKDTETDYSSSEISDIVQNWRSIEGEIECDKCHKFIRYEKVDKYEHLTCSCRRLNMNAAT